MIDIKIVANENKNKKFKLENPKVFKAIISLLFFILIKTHIEDKNKIKGKRSIKILGITIKDNPSGSNIPTS
tara:strand:- start:33 stop:248 length:216 start_codon:yes stop_codon:yes gene_type:complete